MRNDEHVPDQRFKIQKPLIIERWSDKGYFKSTGKSLGKSVPFGPKSARDSVWMFLNQADFHFTQCKQKEIGRQIVTYKLAHTIEPNKLVRVN